MLLCCILFSSTLPSSVSPLLFNHLSGVKTTETTVKNKQIEISERKKKKKRLPRLTCNAGECFFFFALYLFMLSHRHAITRRVCVCVCAHEALTAALVVHFFFFCIYFFIIITLCLLCFD